MKKLILLLFAFCCFSNFLYTQNPSVTKYQKIFSGTGNEEIWDIKQTLDSNYIAVGFTGSVGAGNYDVFVIKIDSVGTKLWEKTYGGISSDGGFSIELTNDGGYILTGYSYSFGSGNGDVYTLKINNVGNVMWSKTYDGASNDIGFSIKQTQDNGFAIFGQTNGLGAGLNDFYLLKTNNLGNLIWSKTFGGSEQDALNDGIITSIDQGFLMVGQTRSFGSGNYDGYVIKTDSLGNVQWSASYGTAYQDELWQVKETNDGGFILVGFSCDATIEGNVWLLKIDNAGTIQWSKKYGGTLTEQAYGVCLAKDGGYTLTTLSYSFSTNSSILIIHTDSLGNVLWSKLYGTQSKHRIPFAIIPTNDDGYITGGLIANPPAFIEDFYFIKTDKNGNSGCLDSTINLSALNYTPNVSSGSITNTGGVAVNASTIVSNQNLAENTLCLAICNISLNANISNVICFGNSNGTATISPSNGTNPYTYSWNTSPIQTTATAINLTAGNYTISVTDSIGCVSDTNITITQPPLQLNVSSTSVTNTTCGNSNGAATLHIIGGTNPYSFNWSPSGGTDSTATGLSSGTFSCFVFDSNGCEDTANVIIGSSAPVLSNQMLTICSNQSITIGGTIHSTSGMYTDLIVAGATNGCDSTVTTNLTVLPPVTSFQTLIVCPGSSVTVGGNTHTTTGIYTDLITAGSINGCDSVVTTDLTVLSASSLQISTICSGDSVTVNGNTYTTTGIYTDLIIAGSINGCDSTITTNLTVVSPITSSQSLTVCNGETITVGSNTYSSTGVFTDLIIAGSVNGCDSTITTNLTVLPTLTSNQIITICAGDSLTIGGNAYTITGIYTDLIASGSINGCDSTVTTNLTVLQPIEASQFLTICAGASIVVSGNTYTTTGIYTDVIIAGSFNGCDSTVNTNLIVNNNSADTLNAEACDNYTLNNQTYTSSGVYTQTQTNVYGCDSVITINLIINSIPTANAGTDTNIIFGSAVTLTALGGVTYVWDNGINTQSQQVSPAITTEYCVAVTDVNGCNDSACVKITVEKPCLSNQNFKIPNAFSPNNDGKNDILCLQGWENCIKEFTILIYDRWGEKVFESNNPSFCWDGTYKGKLINTAVFVYYLKATLINGEEITKKGNISLIR